MTEQRNEEFRRNVALEELLRNLNGDLQPSEQMLLQQYRNKPMEFPLLLIMGPLRSGTTLFLQWLANTGLVAYPTNLLSRFYQAPILGAKIQQLLTDPRYSFRDELGEFAQQAEYRSENGKTKGVLAPNEFWYFWRRFLAEPSRDVWSDQELRQSMDVDTMKAELYGIMDVFQKPFAAKGMLFNYNIPFLDSIFDKIVFIQIKREPLPNIASVLEARKRQLGDDKAWYSFDIPEKEFLLNLSPIEQAAGQIGYINKTVERGLKSVDDSKKITVQYETFCADPQQVFRSITQKLSTLGYATNHDYAAEKSFSPSIQMHLSKSDMDTALSMYMQCYD